MAVIPTRGAQANPFFGNFFAGNDTPFNNSRTLLGVGLGLLSGGTPQQQVAQAASNFVNERQNGQTFNRTIEALRNGGATDLADAVEAGAVPASDAYKLFYQQKLEAQKPKQNFLTVGKNLYNAATGEWVTPPAGIAAADEEYGLNPVWGVDANGKQVIGVLSKSGKFKTLDTNGITPTPTIQNIDLGTSIISQNSRTGAPVEVRTKDVAGEKRAGALGTGEGQAVAEAQAALPSARTAASTVSQQVESLKNDPYLPSMLGAVNSRLPNMTSDSARVQGKIDQLKGGAFLQARQILKGGGAITDFEGQKAEQAYTRMNQAQSVEDFNAALDDFNAAVQSGVKKLEQQAGQGAATASPAGNRTSRGVTWSVEP